MCGIAGFIGEPFPEATARMQRLIRHRGPDEAGCWSNERCTLGIQRLRVIDLKTGQQPVTNETGSIRAVLNGEIYNYRVLREDLLRRGHKLTSVSDTEVLVHLYEDFGESFVDLLRGMFAIAMWDDTRKRLLLVRDRLGKKPLYYAQVDGRFVFASEIKALIGAFPLSRELDHDAIEDYLAYLYVPAPRTIFRSVRTLPPGHLLTWQDGVTTTCKYWQLSPPAEVVRSENEWLEAVRDKLEEAVRVRLLSDVPLGVFLSGGVDSSLIAAIMARNGPTKTFTVGFTDKASGYSELPPARRVAEFLGTDHHEDLVQYDILNILPRIIWHFDQPFGNSTAPLAYLLARFARQHVTVALAGTAGDELFSGYPRHLGVAWASTYSKLPAGLRHAIIEPAAGMLPESTSGNNSSHRFAKRLHRFLDAAALPAGARYQTWLTYFAGAERRELLSPEWRCLLQERDLEKELIELWPRDGDDLQRAMQVDLQTFLPYNQLEYMDKMTMAQSLESRAPFCDHELIELCLNVPSRLRIKGVTSKYLLRLIAEQYLPHDVVRRRKTGFDAPVGAWFKGSMRGFAEAFFARRDRFHLLDGERVRQLYQEHISGRKDLSVQLWMLLVLEVWYELYVINGITEEPDEGLHDVLGLIEVAA